MAIRFLSNQTIDSTLDLTGRVKVSGNNTDQYFYEGARTGVGVTFSLYDNANNVYFNGYSGIVLRANQIGGSGGSIILSGGNVGIGLVPAGSVALDVKEPDASNDLILGLTAGTGSQAQIRSVVQTSTESALSFHTTLSSSTQERFRILNTGAFSLGNSGTNYGTAGQVLTSNGNSAPYWSTPTSGTITGSGTANYVTKFTGTTAIGNSSIVDNGNVGIGGSPSAFSNYTNVSIIGGSSGGNLDFHNSSGTRVAAIVSSSGSSLTIETNENTPLIFQSNQTETMRITGSKFIGVFGNTSPTCPIDFGTTTPNRNRMIGTYVTGNLFTGIGMAASTAGIRLAGDGGADDLLDVGYYSTDGNYTWTTSLFIERGKMTLTSSTQDPYLIIDGSDANRDSGIKINAGSGEKTMVRLDVGSTMFFYDNKLNIFSNSKVSINTTTSYQTFYVNGDMGIPGTNKIVFNNEPNAWFIQARSSALNTPLMSTNLKNLIYCGGGVNEGLAVGGTGTGDVSFEVMNNGLARIKSQLGIGKNPEKPLDVRVVTTASGVHYLGTLGGNNHVAGYAVALGFDPEGYGDRNKVAIAVEGTNQGWSTGKMHFLLKSGTGSSTEATLADSKMVINDSGYVGIGNVSPQTQLQITSNTTTKLRVNTTGAADTSVEIWGYDAGVHIGDNGNGNRWAIWNDGPSTSSSLNFGSYALGTWYVAGSQVMSMTSNGRVGINNTNPGAGLSIIQRETANPTVSVINAAGGGDGYVFQRWQYVDSTTAYRCDLKQRVTSGVVRYSFDVTNNSTDYPFNLSLDRGSVGVGVLTPSHKLDVNGEARFISNSSSRVLYLRQHIANDGNIIQFQDQSGNNVWEVVGRNTTFYIYNNNVGQHSIYVNPSTNNVSIKQTTSSYSLDVNGSIRASADVIAYSDIRKKENIKTLENSLEKVNQLRGVEFNKIGNNKKSIGVIAQEIEKILPEVVHTDDQGYKSVAYGNITALLIEAVKELQQKVEKLENKNCACKG